MQVKTINKIIINKLEEWLDTITDLELKKDVKKNILLSGGSITSMFLNMSVNDYDIYIQDINVLIKLAKYYVKSDCVLDGRKRNEYLEDALGKHFEFDLNDNHSEKIVRIKNLKENQVKLDISSVGQRFENNDEEKYKIAFLSPNAISLTDDIQIVLRFSGSVDEIHKTFDFMHATNYFTFNEGLVTNIKALESILTKELKYQGSLYPITSIIRMKKFINRGWRINAGELLKIMFQISELDLKNLDVLEEQLIGVDIAYFAKLIEIIRGLPGEKITHNYLSEIIDRVFQNFDDEDLIEN